MERELSQCLFVFSLPVGIWHDELILNLVAIVPTLTIMACREHCDYTILPFSVFINEHSYCPSSVKVSTIIIFLSINTVILFFPSLCCLGTPSSTLSTHTVCCVYVLALSHRFPLPSLQWLGKYTLNVHLPFLAYAF